MTFEDCLGSIGAAREISETLRQGFVDANGIIIQQGFYTDSCVPNSLYYLRFNSARNLISESPNNSILCRLSHNYEHVLSTRSLTRLPDEVVERISDDRIFIDPRVRKQKDEGFTRVVCNVLDRAISGISLVK